MLSYAVGTLFALAAADHRPRQMNFVGIMDYKKFDCFVTRPRAHHLPKATSFARSATLAFPQSRRNFEQKLQNVLIFSGKRGIIQMLRKLNIQRIGCFFLQRVWNTSFWQCYFLNLAKTKIPLNRIASTLLIRLSLRSGIGVFVFQSVNLG